MKLFLATGNTHKLAELSSILQASGVSIKVMPPSAVGGMPEVEEDARTFEGNARKKAKALAAVLRERGESSAWAVADDSGLCVDALDGAPGVHSARYAGPGATDGANLAKLLRALAGVAEPQRTAAFHCCLVAAAPDGRASAFEGRCPGRIIDDPRGASGFGYDPVFVPDGFEETFSELSNEVKNTISHRARALAGFIDWLRTAP
ncbi:MAG: RdgB/HAM1 family non-canonical purine NTP pyrophosphatase [Opitutaceae bacterium]